MQSGRMMYQPLSIASLIDHAARYHGDTEIVSALTEGGFERLDWAAVGANAKRIASALVKRGMTNYVQTQDGKRRNRLARALKSGMVETNGVGRGRGAAFGGVKASGRAREGGVWGIEEFMDSKQISGWDADAE